MHLAKAKKPEKYSLYLKFGGFRNDIVCCSLFQHKQDVKGDEFF
jgi:hypothetical protein